MHPRKSVVFPLLALLIFCCIPEAGEAFASPSKVQGQLSISRAIAKIKPSVVYVRSIHPCEHNGIHPWDIGHGTGVIVKVNGDTYITTNQHVVEKASIVEVRVNDNDHTYVQAIVLGRDREKDLALLKAHVKGSMAGKRPAVIASVPAPVGTQVVKAGYPGAVDSDFPTFATGIISNMKAHIGFSAVPYGVTDAQISRGDSGGPLFNLRGEVVGINAMLSIRQEVSIGHFIPADVLTAAIPRLFKGDVRKGWLGITSAASVPLRFIMAGECRYGIMLGYDYNLLYNEITRTVDVRAYSYAQSFDGVEVDVTETFGLSIMSQKSGILIIDVLPWAGYSSLFKRGDIIASYGGRIPLDAHELVRWIAETEPGMSVPVSLYRDGSLARMTVTTVEYAWDWKPAAHANGGVESRNPEGDATDNENGSQY